jgi:N-acetylglucosaminyldiphosphoundecaprenol N-acetyl-beta-D-mannosaminyltransferase
MLSGIKTVNVGGIKTACINRYDLANFIGNYATQDEANIKPVLIFSANGHSVSEANVDPKYMEIMAKADLVHADGQSIVNFSKWVAGNESIPERTATTDMIHDVPNMFNGMVKHFLLGGKKEIVEKSASIMADKYEKFEVVGTQDGYFSIEEEDKIIEKINNSGCQVLWVGLGKPKEQEFCIRNKDKLNVPVIISCGGCYNFITGDYSRAPQWMQDKGIEWIHRVLTRPKQLFWRYLTTNPHAIFCVLKHKYRSAK